MKLNSQSTQCWRIKLRKKIIKKKNKKRPELGLTRNLGHGIGITP
jgi:hypothetical protein